MKFSPRGEPTVHPFRDRRGGANAKALDMEQDLGNMTMYTKRQDFDKMRSSNGPSTGHSGTGVLDQHTSSSDDTSLRSPSPVSPAPICRQFWKAGNYKDGLASKSILQNSGSYLHIHPKFLHSNATSHKWAFGAIAELLDNAVDEIQNGATFVIVDKTSNPRDGKPALLIQDDGGGMDPEGMRRCLSFGFSDKKSKSAIGHYGNGFKTSSMRLGADVIVFSRCSKERKITQSVGLLSYTFLMQTGFDRIVVPMVDYEFNTATSSLKLLSQSGKDPSMSDLSLLLQWSPYSTEDELLEQFDDMGHHGTKLVIYNLWCTDEGAVELDFDSDPEDIRLRSAEVSEKGYNRLANEQHMANQLLYSLRVYLSILYLRIPGNFAIILRGKVVMYHNIGSDLKHPEFIVYRPHRDGTVEGEVITTIGFLKEAPRVNVHGFSLYHKNRLILPFWEVVSRDHTRWRGVVGVLEANFIEPTHNKQDFEKTSVFQKLEARLRDMTKEYWNLHCELIGYHEKRKKTTASIVPAHGTSHKDILQPVVSNKSFSTSSSAVPPVPQLKRKQENHLSQPELANRKTISIDTRSNQSAPPTVDLLEDAEATNLMRENKNLRTRLMQYENYEKELNFKVTQLQREFNIVEKEYAGLLAELQLLDETKDINSVMMR